jgi:signal transduction histidine kinase
MAERLREHEERLKGLATLEERERIAQELHDSLAQDLALLHLKVVEAERNLVPGDSAAAIETLKEMRRIVDNAYEDVRQAIFGLRTMVSKGLGLIPTLTEYLHEFSEVRKIPVDFKIDGVDGVRFSPQVEIQLIRIIHEALINVFKHARATRSKVKFERDEEFAQVTIEDNGQGFRPQQVMRNGFHFGLQTMRERAEGAGGSLAIETVPSRGTKVIVRLPYEKSSYETHSSAPGR